MGILHLPNKNRNVLVVDDEKVIRDVCMRSLQSKNFEVEVAENGIKAMEWLRSKHFDIVFSDFKMPIMDGIELLETVKRDHPHVEVIIMTAFATIESAILAMKNGAYDFILKPVKPDQIRLVAEKCFEKIELGAENKALRLANEKLTELQNMKNKFIAVTSHELRTPVSHLKGYLGILNDDYYHQLSETEKNQCMTVILEAISDLEDIVTSMHTLIHMEDGGPRLKQEQLDLNELLQQSVHSYQLIAKKRRQHLKLADSDENLPVVVDRSQIKGILNELIQNAIKFTPDGGNVEVSASSDGEFCVVRVKDDGIGIHPSEQGKIFEKFYEIQNSNYHSSSKEAFLGGGLGLGLPSVRAIAEAHGGGVKVVSETKKGSEFRVYLPLQSSSKGK